MSTIEYYYPLETLTTNSVSNKFFFKNDSSTIPTTTTTPIPIPIPKTRINFAMSNGIKGTAKEYYIKTINIGVTPIVNGATHYLVILHESANLKFYVLFPLKSVPDVSSYIKSDRNGGILSKSIENLNNVSTVNTKVKFSLESVVDSMKSFNPTSYYKFSVTKNTTPTTQTTQTIPTTPTTPPTTYDVVVMNDLIYVNTINSDKFYGGDIEFNPVSPQPSLLQASIQKVSATSECKAPVKKTVKAKKTLFTGLSYKEQSKLNYMNFVMILASLLYLLASYHLYYNYDFFKTKETSIFIFMMVALLFITIPVGITMLLLKTPGAKINQNDLRYGVIFARYSIVAIVSSLVAIFSKQILRLIQTPPDWSVILNSLKTNWEMNLVFGLISAIAFAFSIIIFFTV